MEPPQIHPFDYPQVKNLTQGRPFYSFIQVSLLLAIYCLMPNECWSNYKQILIHVKTDDPADYPVSSSLYDTITETDLVQL